jgi:hypothetical protein
VNVAVPSSTSDVPIFLAGSQASFNKNLKIFFTNQTAGRTMRSPAGLELPFAQAPSLLTTNYSLPTALDPNAEFMKN